MSDWNYLETSERFIKFLIAFWVKWIEEYKTFTEEQKQICVREYLKDLWRKN